MATNPSAQGAAEAATTSKGNAAAGGGNPGSTTAATGTAPSSPSAATPHAGSGDGSSTSMPAGDPITQPHAHRIDLVEGGPVRTIVFQDGGRRASGMGPGGPAAAAPEPAPATDSLRTAPTRMAGATSGSDPRGEIDLIVPRSTTVTTSFTPRTVSRTIRSRTVFSTPRGEVRSWDDGERRAWSIVRRDGGHEEDVRFLHAQVDRVIGGISSVATRSEASTRSESYTATSSTTSTATSSTASNGHARASAAAPIVTLRERTEQDYRIVQPVAELQSDVATTELPQSESHMWEEPLRPLPVPVLERAAPTTPPRKAPPVPFVGYEGDNHPVIDLEGIGPEFARRLRAVGIETTARLCYEDGDRLAEVLQLPAYQVKEWQAMAELIKVSGIGKQFAEILARVGVTGIDDLKKRKAADLEAAIEELTSRVKVTIVGTKVTRKRIEGWQKAARQMRKKKLPVPEN